MKKSKYSDAQIMSILKQAENSAPVADLCREHGKSSASFYEWRSKYDGLDASLMARMKEHDEVDLSNSLRENPLLSNCLPTMGWETVFPYVPSNSVTVPRTQ